LDSVSRKRFGGPLGSGRDKSQLTASADGIDRELAKNPLDVGEAREGTSRILILAPLAVEYDVIMDDHKVIVWHVWRWTAPED
jgi:hypothetical protein